MTSRRLHLAAVDGERVDYLCVPRACTCPDRGCDELRHTRLATPGEIDSIIAQLTPDQRDALGLRDWKPA